MTDVILHAFNWRYAEIAERAEEIAERGYGAVLFPPPLYSDPDQAIWWQRYQPKDYRLIRSYLGGKKEIEDAIAALHEGGVRAYADIVFNHMANEKGFRDDPYDFPGARELARYRDESKAFEKDKLYGDLREALFDQKDFNPQGDISNWNDIHESQEHWLSGLPDLDLSDKVVAQQRACIAALNALGFDGYRVDAVKHLPIEHVTRVFQNDETKGKFVFGEALTANDNEESIFLWPLLDKTRISYYDFVLHETLRRVFSPGGTMRELIDPASYGQALPFNRAVTMTVTHDIPNNDGFRWQLLDTQDEFLANAYILGRDGGIPLVYSDHNESAEIFPSDMDRWKDAWRRPDIAGMVAFHNAVHGKGQSPLFEDDLFIAFARGDSGLVAINKSNEWQHPRVWTSGLRQGRYRCQIHGIDMDIRGEHFEFAIPPRQAQAWLYQE